MVALDPGRVTSLKSEIISETKQSGIYSNSVQYWVLHHSFLSFKNTFPVEWYWRKIVVSFSIVSVPLFLSSKPVENCRIQKSWCSQYLTKRLTVSTSSTVLTLIEISSKRGHHTGSSGITACLLYNQVWTTVAIQGLCLTIESIVQSGRSSLRRESKPSKGILVPTAPDRQNWSNWSEKTSNLDFLHISCGKDVEQLGAAQNRWMNEAASNGALFKLHRSLKLYQTGFFLRLSSIGGPLCTWSYRPWLLVTLG